MGTNMGTGLPNKSMMPRPPQNPNTAGPTAQGHLDNFNADNGAVGANAMATPTANSGTTLGDALTQLYNTQNSDQRAYGQVLNPTLSGGQFPPGAPVVSGTEQLIGPSLAASDGYATADAVQRLNYINALPWNMPASINGAAVNGPTTLMEGPAQPGGMPQAGALYSPPGVKNARAHMLNSQPQPPLNLGLNFPQSNLGGGLR